MAAPPRGSFNSRARYIALGTFSAAYGVAMAAPPLVRFAAVYLLLGALWLANANTIAKAFERCLGVDCAILDDIECAILDDIECRQSLGFSVVGPMSLFLLRWHWRRLSQACEAAVGAHDDVPPEGPALEPGRPCPPAGIRNEFDMFFVFSFAGSFVMIWLQGFIYRLFSPEIGSPAASLGNILTKLGCLGTAYACCILVIPSVMLGLRMFHMEMDMAATAA